MQSANVNIGCDFLVAGIDAGGARVCYVGHPGTLVWLDKLGYGAIGSGAVHATMRLSLGAQTRDTPLAASILAVYTAKKGSEVAPGVGNETDVAIVYADRIDRCSPNTMQELDRLFKESAERLAPDLGGLTALVTPGAAK